MVLVILTLILISVGLIAYIYGAVRLAKFGFRISTLVGLAVLLFPPYTFYFAFKKAEVNGKELPTALCCFGLVLTLLLGGIFWQPLSMTFSGNIDQVEELMTPDRGEQYMADYDDEDVEEGEALPAGDAL